MTSFAELRSCVTAVAFTAFAFTAFAFTAFAFTAIFFESSLQLPSHLIPNVFAASLQPRESNAHLLRVQMLFTDAMHRVTWQRHHKR
jgi:hypothetical protein